MLSNIHWYCYSTSLLLNLYILFFIEHINRRVQIAHIVAQLVRQLVVQLVGRMAVDNPLVYMGHVHILDRIRLSQVHSDHIRILLLVPDNSNHFKSICR